LGGVGGGFGVGWGEEVVLGWWGFVVVVGGAFGDLVVLWLQTNGWIDVGLGVGGMVGLVWAGAGGGGVI